MLTVSFSFQKEGAIMEISDPAIGMYSLKAIPDCRMPPVTLAIFNAAKGIPSFFGQSAVFYNKRGRLKKGKPRRKGKK